MRNRPLFIFLLTVVLLPVVLYLRVWDYYALNIPKWDDHTLKAFLLDYLNASTLAEKWKALSRQHNEHRILLTRLLAWWDYAYFGQLNYKHLMFAGNLLLLSVILLWWRILAHHKKPLFALVPIAFIWPTLAHWENMYWGMASVQNFGVVTLALIALYWTVRGPWPYFIAGLATAALAAFSSGNGLLVFPILIVILFLQRETRKGIIGTIAGIVFTGLYFFNFEKVDYNPSAQVSIGQLFKGFFTFLGSFAEVFPVKGSQDTCVVFGVLLTLVALSIVSTTLFRLIRNSYDTALSRRTDAFLLGTLLFLLGTAAIVVWSRAGFGMETLMTSRYKLYSFLLLITAYLFIVIPIRGSFFNPYVSGITLLAILFNIFAYHNYLVDAYNLRRFLTTSHFNQLYTTRELNPFKDSGPVHQLVDKPALFYEKWLPLIPHLEPGQLIGNVPQVKTIQQNTRVQVVGKEIRIANSSYRNQRLQDSGVYILLCSAERYYLLPTYRTRNTNRKQLFFRQQYFANGFHAEIPLGGQEDGDIAAGEYQVATVYQQGDQMGMLLHTQTITVPQLAASEKIKTNW